MNAILAAAYICQAFFGACACRWLLLILYSENSERKTPGRYWAKQNFLPQQRALA